MRRTSLIASTLHFCEGIRCSSACISSASASASEVFPSPLSPCKSQAQDTGRFAKADRILRCFSKPIKPEIVRGRYFSESGCGKAKDSVLMRHFRLCRRRKLLRRRQRKCPSLLPCMGGSDAVDNRVLQGSKQCKFPHALREAFL